MKKRFLYWLAETALLLLTALLPAVFMLWPGDAPTVLALLISHILYPALAFMLPLWAAKHGAGALLCALPPFCIYLPAWVIRGLNPPALPCILTLLFAVVGAATGEELRKRAMRKQK